MEEFEEDFFKSCGRRCWGRGWRRGEEFEEDVGIKEEELDVFFRNCGRRWRGRREGGKEAKNLSKTLGKNYRKGVRFFFRSCGEEERVRKRELHAGTGGLLCFRSCVEAVLGGEGG